MDRLSRAARKTAIATVLFKKWISWLRHDFSYAPRDFSFNSVGLKARYRPHPARCPYAKDEEVFDRLSSIKTTYEAAARGKPISGRAELVKFLGDDAVSAIEKWCGGSSSTSPSQHPTSLDITTDAGAADAFANAMRDDLIFRDDIDRWFKKHQQVFRWISPVLVQGEAKEFMQQQVASIGSRSFSIRFSRVMSS